MENKELYKIRPKEFIPYYGFMKYMKRNRPNEKTEKRATSLLVYNLAFTIGAIAGTANGLVELLK